MQPPPRYITPADDRSTRGGREMPVLAGHPPLTPPPPQSASRATSEDLRAYSMQRPMDLEIAPASAPQSVSNAPAPEVRVEHQQVRRPSRLVWAGIGFIAGIAVWHFVGFWSFVSDVVLTGQAPKGKLTTMILAPPPVPVVKSERAAAATRVETPTSAPAPATSRAAPRPSPASWSTRVTTSSID